MQKLYILTIISILFVGKTRAYPNDSLFNKTKAQVSIIKLKDTYLLDELYKKCISYVESKFLFEELSTKTSEEALTLNKIAFARRLEFFGLHADAIELTEDIRTSNFENAPHFIKAEYYRCLGYISINSEDPTSALKYYKIGKGFADKTDNLELKQSLLSSCGVALNANGEHEKAMNYFNSSLELEIKGVNRNSLKTRLNIALTKSHLGDLEDAKKLFIESLELLRDQNDFSSEIRSLGNIGDIYLKQDSLEQAQDYFLQAKELAVKQNQNLDLIRLNFSLSKVYQQSGEFERAYHFLSLSDSLSTAYNSNNEAANRLANIETKNEIKLRDDILVLQNEKERMANRNKWIFVALSSLLSAAIILLLRYILQLKKKNKLLLKHEVEEIGKAQRNGDISANHKELIEKLTAISKSELVKDSNLNLEKLAKKLGTNRTYLSEAINTHYRLTFSQWINKERINAAKKMLISVDFDKYSIEGIANLVGFSSISTFNQQFKTNTGLTPSYFRKNRLK